MAFFALPSEIKKLLIEYFSQQPPGTKIDYGTELRVDTTNTASSSNYREVNRYVLQNSYIKLGNNVYALGRGDDATVGKGQFGTVQYLQSLSSNAVYVVKIQAYMPGDGKLKDIKQEDQSLYDLGLYRDSDSLEEIEGSKDYGAAVHYTVMLDAGTPLNKILTSRIALSPAARFDIAIKLCWAVDSLHQGLASRTGTTYAHRDLKPANIALGKAGEIRLIDMGLCQIDLDQAPKDFCGAPGYLPSLMTMLSGNVTLRHMDILALKRVIYVPDDMLCAEGRQTDTTGRHFGMPMIFSKKLLNDVGLFPYFDTSASVSDQQLFQGAPLILASLLVLGKCGLLNAYAPKVIKNPTLTYAVLGLYFANPGMSDNQLAVEIAGVIKAYLLFRVSPRHRNTAERTIILRELLNSGITSDLNLAVSDNVLIDLITGDSVSIKRAAGLLWQNGFREHTTLNLLKYNRPLAQKVIELIFDGDLVGVRTTILELQRALATARESAVYHAMPAVPASLPMSSQLASAAAPAAPKAADVLVLPDLPDLPDLPAPQSLAATKVAPAFPIAKRKVPLAPEHLPPISMLPKPTTNSAAAKPKVKAKVVDGSLPSVFKQRYPALTFTPKPPAEKTPQTGSAVQHAHPWRNHIHIG